MDESSVTFELSVSGAGEFGLRLLSGIVGISIIVVFSLHIWIFA